MSDAHQTFAMEDHLTMAEVPDILVNFKKMPADQWPTIIDLKAVVRGDSSALALLLELKHLAEKNGHTLEFTHPPKALTTLAGLSGIDGLLGWAAPLAGNQT